MKRIIVLLVAAAAMQMSGASALAASGSDVAKGRGTTFFGDRFDFSATAAFNDIGARGSVRLSEAIGATEVTFTGDVTCLRVVGNLAVIGANITNISPPVAFFSDTRSVIVQASDGGKFSSTPDRVFWVRSTLPAPPDGACPSLAAGPAISTGDIVVIDAIA